MLISLFENVAVNEKFAASSSPVEGAKKGENASRSSSSSSSSSDSGSSSSGTGLHCLLFSMTFTAYYILRILICSNYF